MNYDVDVDVVRYYKGEIWGYFFLSKFLSNEKVRLNYSILGEGVYSQSLNRVVFGAL